MRILFTGATGVIGRLAIPMLMEAGHQVDAVHRAESDATWLSDIGADPVKLDLFDRTAVTIAVSRVQGIIHYATSIPAMAAMKNRSAWATNDLLRTKATNHLVDAAIGASVDVFVQESITFNYADSSDQWVDEQSAIDPPWEVTKSALVAEREVQRYIEGGGSGVILRMASLYGPSDASQELVGAIRAGKMPIIGSGDNFVSNLATVDAASATVAALQAAPGIYNVADDQPVTIGDSLTALAKLTGAKPPRKVPRWVGRLAAGKASNLLVRSNRISNERIVTETGWKPVYRSILEGWPHAVVDDTAA